MAKSCFLSKRLFFFEPEMTINCNQSVLSDIRPILMRNLLLLTLMISPLPLCAQQASPQELTFATYNVSMEAENYFPRGTPGNSEKVLIKR
jgi:hypothetical protein